jgi:hypothetical protein
VSGSDLSWSLSIPRSASTFTTSFPFR